MRAWLQDLKFAARVLAHRRRYTVAALIALALGIGANTAIFSVFNALLLKPLDLPSSETLVRLWTDNDGKGIDDSPLSPVAYADIRENAESFEDLAGWWRPDLNLTSGDGEPQRVRAINATDNFFDTLGVTPVLGRRFAEGEDVTGGPKIAILGHALWQKRFGSDDGVVGSTVDLDGVAYEIVGVAPSGFDFPDETELWLPLGWDPQRHYRGARFFGAVGRLKDGVTPEQAAAETARFYQGFASDFPDTNEGWSGEAVVLREDLVGDLRPAFRVLLGAAAFVLMIACANVANLLLAQGAARSREVAVRGALGASGSRLAGQFLTESLLLGLLGGILGSAVAWVGVRVLVAAAPPDIPRLDEVHIDATFLALAIGIAMASSLLFGLAPAWQAWRTDFVESLKDGSRGQSAGVGGKRLRSALVIAEVALALTLLAGAGILIRSFDRLLEQSTGFRPEQTLAFNLQIPRSSYGEWSDVTGFYDRLLAEVTRAPGVESAAVTAFLPLEPGWRVDIGIEGRESTSDREQPEVQYHAVSEDYFRVMGIPLERGRGLSDRDTADQPGAVLINRAAAERYWPDEDPVGERVKGYARAFGPLGQVLTEELEAEIVGIVGDVKNTSLEGNVEPAMYFSQKQFAYRSMNVVARGGGDPRALIGAVKDAVWRLDSNLPLAEIQTLEEHLDGAVAERRFIMGLVTCFAVLALVLSAVGIYGVVSFLAQQRKHEVGIRVALGAKRHEVMGMIIGQGLKLVGWGIALGLLGAFAMHRSLQSLVYGISLGDPLTVIGGVSIILLAAFAACGLPALRMADTQPAEVLRAD